MHKLRKDSKRLEDSKKLAIETFYSEYLDSTYYTGEYEYIRVETK